MKELASKRSGAGLSPAARTAVAAALASAATACCVIVLWSVLPTTPSSPALVFLPLMLMPLVIAGVVWATARRAIEESLDPVIEALSRLAAHDFVPSRQPGATSETARLMLAVEDCRAALEERHRATKVHSAVARLMGAGISSLSKGDFSARISLELPEPYRAFRDEFNTAMEDLQTRFDGLDGAGERLQRHRQEIDEAAGQLMRRACKLAERVDAELLAMEAHSVDEALRMAKHLIGGVAVAAQRNVEASRTFATLAERIGNEAGRLLPAGDDGTMQGEAAAMPAATMPARISSAA